MNIQLSNNLSSKIKALLLFCGLAPEFTEFNNAFLMALKNEPKEINYKNFGKQNRLTERIDAFLAEKGGTDFNYLSLKRDKSGRFLRKYRYLKEFYYHSFNSNTISARLVEPTEKNNLYIVGRDIMDNEQIKSFKKTRIIGRVKTVKQSLY